MIKTKRGRGIGVVLALGLIAGCSNTPKLRTSADLKVYEGTQLPPPSRIDLTAAVRPVLIGPFDKLTVAIDTSGIPEPTREVDVDETGRVYVPGAGVVTVSGMSPSEAAALLQSQLRAKYVRDPHVTVSLKESVSQVLTVEGEVKNPGQYPVLGETTLLQAMANAKGVTEFAATDDVLVFRTVDGQRLAALYDLKKIRHGTIPDPQLYPKDIIVVGDSPTRRLLRDLASTLPLLSTPVLILNNL